jgi:hypothetical protein
MATIRRVLRHEDGRESEDALSFLAVEGIPFTVEGPARYEELCPGIGNPSGRKLCQSLPAQTPDRV